MIHYQIDNMEGLAVRPGENGETLLTIVSDDNDSLLAADAAAAIRAPAGSRRQCQGSPDGSGGRGS